MSKLFLIFVLILPLIAASCNETQIDINNSTIEELDLIYGIGEAKAQNIIDSRPFENLGELINVSGIGEYTYNKIMEQDLICISSEFKKNSSVEKISKTENSTEFDEDFSKEKKENFFERREEKMNNFTETSKNITKKTIYLNPKTIKKEKTNSSLGEKNYTKYSIIAFCILLFFLYSIKPRKKKNEWQ